MATKFTKAVTINGAGSEVVLDGFDFTGDAFVTISNATSITVKNCRVYGLNTATAGDKHWLSVVGDIPLKMIIEKNFFGDSPTGTGKIKGIFEPFAKLKTGTSVSSNYFTENSCTEDHIAIYGAEEGASININNNELEVSDCSVKIAMKGEPTCTINMSGNNVAAARGSDPLRSGIALITPYGTETTSFANCTITMSGNTVDGDYPLIAMYSDDGDTVLTEELMPTATVDSEPYVIPILHGTPVAVVDNVVYTTLSEAIAAANGNEIVLYKNVTEDITLSEGQTLNLRGVTKETEIQGMITLTGTGTSAINVTMSNLTLNNNASKTFGITSENKTAENQLEASVTLNDVIIKGYETSGVYMTNAKTLSLTKVSFDNASNAGEYALNLNLIAVQNATVTIDQCNFTQKAGTVSAIRVACRGGLSDAGSPDAASGAAAATLSQLTISNCAFNTDPSTPCDVMLGAAAFTSGGEANTTANFNVSITGCTTDVRVKSPYKADGGDTVTTVTVGQTGTKEAAGDLVVA